MAQTAGLIVYDPQAEETLARWIMDDVLGNGMEDKLHHCLSAPAAPTGAAAAAATTAPQIPPDDADFAEAARAAILSHVSAHRAEADTFVFLVAAVYWDGQAQQGRASFARLKLLSEEGSASRAALVAEIAALPADGVRIELLVQALNAKRGEHTMRDNRVALVQTLQKKLAGSQLIAAKGIATFAAGGAATAAAGKASSSAALSIGEADISPAAIAAAVDHGQGECFFVVSGATKEAILERVAELRVNAAAAAVAVRAVMPEPREVKPRQQQQPGDGAGAAQGAVIFAQEFLLRLDRAGEHFEMRLAMCGNVDSGKSTLTSVLTRGWRDDGRGLARAFVFNHRHEAATGRTSSISENYLGFTGTGEVVNYDLGTLSAAAAAATESPVKAPRGAAAPSGASRALTPQELSSRSAKFFTLYDLAGHEKYLKTTVLGMTRNMPDYATIVISANNGIQRMTKEHLALCLALELPFCIVVTRIDSTPPNVLKETMVNIGKLLKIPTVRKLPYPVTKPDEIILAAKNLSKNVIAPIFELSNVTGQGLPELVQFLNLLPMRRDWRAARRLPKEMIIDSTFFVGGVGTVVAGICTQGHFSVNDTVLLGPDGLGHFRPVAIKSIHIKGVDSLTVEAGNDAALCLKKEKRSAIRKGNILADPLHPPVAHWQFEAEITILYHSTTITTDYEPVIHSTTVRQSARMTYVAQDTLRTGDKSIVRFHFLYRPEFMKLQQRLIFREGRTKGIGIVTRLITEPDESLLSRTKMRRALLNRPQAVARAATAVGGGGGANSPSYPPPPYAATTAAAAGKEAKRK